MEEREGARGPSRNDAESPGRLPFPSPTRPAAAAAAAAPSSPPAAAPARRAVTLLLLLYPSSSSPRCPCPLSSPLLPFPSAPLARTRARSSRTVSHSHARPPAARARTPGDALPADRAARPGPGGDTALLGLEGWTVAGGEGTAAFCLSQTLGRTHGAGSRQRRPGAGCGRRRRQQQGLLSRLYVPVIVCLGHLRRGSPPPYTW